MPKKQKKDDEESIGLASDDGSLSDVSEEDVIDDVELDDEVEEAEEEVEVKEDDEERECYLGKTEEDEEELVQSNKAKKDLVPKEERRSNNILTTYEMVRIIGTRMKQLTMGAKPMVKVVGNMTMKEIAIHELINNTLPFKIRRYMGDGKIEIWSLDELKKDHLTALKV